LNPLFFGAAWKVFDLLVELSLAGQPPNPDRGSERSIKQKAANAASGAIAPLDSHPELWDVIARTYGGTSEVRHALVHRTVNVDMAGALTGTDRQGRQLRPVSTAEQESFCRAAHRAADAVISQTLRSRERNDLAWHLGRLVAHHNVPVKGAVQLGGSCIPLLIANLREVRGKWFIDVDWMLSQARAKFSASPHIDFEVHVPDGSQRRYRGELEGLPAGAHEVDLAVLPPWLTPA
jgi:hypothetical protein